MQWSCPSLELGEENTVGLESGLEKHFCSQLSYDDCM